jgi:hypothetical protein
MIRRPVLVVVAAVALTAAASARAADIKVSYLVDSQLLRINAIAGTVLTFQLYGESSCATPIATQAVNIENTTLIETIKPVSVKGAPKPPSAAEIDFTMTGVTPQVQTYAKVTGTGITPIGGPCQLQNASVGRRPPPPPPSCPPDSVKVGSACVDKYEASLWQIPPGATTVIQHVQDGTATLAELTGAGATEFSLANTCAPSIPGTFPPDGNYTSPLYAVSVAGVIPTACVTAYQAIAACGLSTKRLPTNPEWTAAGNGTAPGFNDNGTTDCNTLLSGNPSNTGSRSSCVSTAGAFDMVGNVWEWTLDPGVWIRGGSWSYGSDASVLYAEPFAPSRTHRSFGFRCAR